MKKLLNFIAARANLLVSLTCVIVVPLVAASIQAKLVNLPASLGHWSAQALLFIVLFIVSVKITSRLGLGLWPMSKLYLAYDVITHGVFLLLSLVINSLWLGFQYWCISFVSYFLVLFAGRQLFITFLDLYSSIKYKLVTPKQAIEKGQPVKAELVYSDSAWSDKAKTAWIISFTGVSNEPRVLRQSRVLRDAGWNVVVLGYDGHSERPADWQFIRLPQKPPYTARTYQLLSMMKVLGLMLAVYVPVFKELGARLYHRSIGNWRYVRTEALRTLKENPQISPDLVISHDYFTCDVGYSLAEKAGAKFSVDCHEYSAGQYMHDPKWVKFQRPYVIGMQDYFLSRADVVTTVCKGIASLLNEEHSIQKEVQVVRSVPFKNSQTFKPTGDTIDVLYHGDVSYARGLHKVIQSMPLWREEFTLTVRGSGDQEYLDFLGELAEDEGVSARVKIEGAVPFDRIIPEANQSDIGYFVHRDISPQKRFTLPNKFFEYIMAGTALCVSDLPEMARIVKRYDCGKLVPAYDVHEIAAVINSFTKESIDEYKKASIKASEELNWASEGRIMLEAYETAVDEIGMLINMG